MISDSILICLTLYLPPWLSSVFLDKANMPVVRTGSQAHYGFILDCLYLESVQTVQAFLKGNKYHELAKETYTEDTGHDEDDVWRDAI